MIGRLLACVCVASVALLGIAGPVAAHIDPDPTQAQAGSTVTVGFTVEHGCDGSPTTQLDMRLPEGVVDPVAEAVGGWVGSVDTVDGDMIVTFVGGPLADDVEGTFEVTMTLPPTPETTIYFPFVQRCDVGEIRWIGIPTETGDELDEPAPAMELTGPVATTSPTTVGPVPTDSAGTEAPSTSEPSTTTGPTTGPTTEPSTDDTASSSTTEPALITADVDEAGSSTTGTIAFVVSIAAVLAIGGLIIFRSRQSRAESAPSDS